MNNIYLNNNNYLIVQSNEYAIISYDDLSKCNFFVQLCQYDQNTFNRPLPSSGNPHFQSNAKYTAFLDSECCICMRMKNHFQIKG